MTKAPSAEVGQRRYYHLAGSGYPCSCDQAKPNLACPNTFPSVTTILKVLPKEWLGAWAAKMVAQTALDEIDNLAAMLSQEGRDAVERYDSSEAWTTTGLTNPNLQKLSVSFTPQEKGFVHAVVKVAAASKTVYVDPVLTLA